MTDVAIVDTGIANIASMRAALARIGCTSRLVSTREAVSGAPYVVLPGVGSFAAGMQRLRALDLADALRQRVADGRPLLAVCLGLQLLCRESEESPGVAGLGVIDGAVKRFSQAPIVPQLGWNRVRAGDSALLEDGYAYYANSFCLPSAPAGWRTAVSEHGERFVAALERDQVLACQFHPELSGPWGHTLLRRWLQNGGASC